jgi:hypothetical protein
VPITVVGAATFDQDNPTSGNWDLATIDWAEGDLAVFFWHCRFIEKVLTPDSDVTTEIMDTGPLEDAGRLYVGTRWMQGADGDIFSFTATSITNGTTVWGVLVLRGAQGSGPAFESTSGADVLEQIETTSPNPPATIVHSPGAWVLTFIGSDDDSSAQTPPSGYTVRAFDQSIGAGAQSEASVASKEVASPATEDPGAWSLTTPATTDHVMWTASVAVQSEATRQELAHRAGGRW